MRHSIHDGLKGVTSRVFGVRSPFWLPGVACAYVAVARAQPPDPVPPVLPEGVEVVRTLEIPGAVGEPMDAPTAQRLYRLLEKARCGGKYRMLLQQIAAPEVAKSLGEFQDLGQLDPALPTRERIGVDAATAEVPPVTSMTGATAAASVTDTPAAVRPVAARLPLAALLPAMDEESRHGYWVYAAPYWYVWHDGTATPLVRRPWGPEQAIGAPDTE